MNIETPAPAMLDMLSKINILRTEQIEGFLEINFSGSHLFYCKIAITNKVIGQFNYQFDVRVELTLNNTKVKKVFSQKIILPFESDAEISLYQLFTNGEKFNHYEWAYLTFGKKIEIFFKQYTSDICKEFLSSQNTDFVLGLKNPYDNLLDFEVNIFHGRNSENHTYSFYKIQHPSLFEYADVDFFKIWIRTDTKFLKRTFGEVFFSNPEINEIEISEVFSNEKEKRFKVFAPKFEKYYKLPCFNSIYDFCAFISNLISK